MILGIGKKAKSEEIDNDPCLSRAYVLGGEKTRGEKSLEAVGMQGQKPQSKYKRTRGKCRSCNVHISGHLRKRKSNQGRRADI